VPKSYRYRTKNFILVGFLETALPTFERVDRPAGPAVRLILFARNLP
jgi:hypothetical protein